jgi:UDP-N-acetylmuramoyl-tripeptide--D-alanyl-D-alanine ligase
MLLHVGSRQGGASATRGNNNAVPGVSRTMAYTRREHRWAVIEMGFGPPRNGISTSSKTVEPHIALITSIGRAHLDMFKPQELEEHGPERMVLSKKLQILDGMAAGGTAVFNRDIPHFEFARESALERGLQLISFGEHPQADARLLRADLDAAGSRIRALVAGEEFEYSLALPGKHMVMNSIGVLAAVAAGGGDAKKAAEDLASFEPVAGRARVVDAPFGSGQIHLIDDSFNATPTSIESSLSLLQLAQVRNGGRRVAALGEMGHLGEKEAEIHASLAPLFDRYQVDKLFTWGPLMKHLHDAVPASKRGEHCNTVPELYQAVRAFLKPGDALTVKSGRGQGGLGDARFKRFIHGMKLDADRIE